MDTLGRIICVSLLFAVGCSSGEKDAGEADLRRLEGLGYVNRVPVSDSDRDSVGVVGLDPERASPGLSLYNSRSSTEARLITLEGEVVHTWSSDVTGAALRRYERVGDPPSYMSGWNHVVMADNGDLLAIGSHHVLLRLDWESNLLWSLDLAAHHDVFLAEDGDVYVLDDVPDTFAAAGQSFTLLDNHIVVLTSGGEEKRRISLLDAMLRSRALAPAVRWAMSNVGGRQARRLDEFREELATAASEDRGRIEERMRLYEEALAGNTEADRDIKGILLHDAAEDILHSNSIFVASAGAAGLWKPGDLIVCVRNLGLVVVLDSETGDVLWSWGADELEQPHHATHVANGNIFVFDNGTWRGFSRVLELDPQTREIVWEYRADPPESFFTSSRGGSQKLPNDNVLIAETNRGYAFEVTRSGDVVWEFFNPDLAEDRGGIYRMTRIPLDAVADRLP